MLLFSELSIFINLFYLCFIILDMIIHGKKYIDMNIFTVHLIFSLMLASVRDGIFFVRNSISDYRKNNEEFKVLTKNGEIHKKHANLRVGDVI